MTTGGVRVNDVVRRVKCELADAVADAVLQKKLKWLETWTARIDLTLQVEVQAGLTPSTTFVQTFHNAYSTAAGATTLGGSTIAAIPRSFSLGGGLNLSSQATRTDILSFALSFDELQDWRAREKANAQREGLPDSCPPASGTGVLSDLGLREWVLESLDTVAEGELTAGDNPAPTYTAAKASTPSAMQPKITPEPILWSEVKQYVESIKTQLEAASKAYRQAQATVSKVKKIFSNGPYADILSPAYKSKLEAVVQNATAQMKVAEGEEDFAKQVIYRAVCSVTDHDSVPDGYKEYIKCSTNTSLQCHDGKSLPETLTIAEYKNAVACATEAARQAQSDAQKAATDASKISKPDAPILGLSQSVNFIVTFGASVTPTWMLTVWRGPTGTLAGEGIRTHTLDIAIGPRPSNGQKTSPEQAASITALQFSRLTAAQQH